MVTLSAFRALRPPPALAARVASPPYDVVSTQEARDLARGNSDSFLHVSRPEIDLPGGIDEHSHAVHAKGRDNLAELLRRGVLVQDPEPRLYVYAQRMGEHRQTGLVACAAADDYDTGVIKKHENTRPDKEDDRTRHIDALSAHDEPVFLTYRAVAAIDRAIGEVKRAAPTYDLATTDGVGHQLWVVPAGAGEAITALFRSVPALYVADGHHRCAAASRVHALRRGQPGEHGAFPAVLFPHDQVQIIAYNRLVRDPAGRGAEALLAALRKVFDIEPAASAVPDEPLTFGVFAGGRWWRARARPGSYDASDPVASLDCSIVQEKLLAALFGVADPRTSKDVDFVGGIRGAQELERRVCQEGWSLALHLFPTRVEQLMAVSDAGKLMPPKSTWFEPKLRSGLFVHSF
jgi:uncharacterized protein (DUF1015 family)